MSLSPSSLLQQSSSSPIIALHYLFRLFFQRPSTVAPWRYLFSKRYATGCNNQDTGPSDLSQLNKRGDFDEVVRAFESGGRNGVTEEKEYIRALLQRGTPGHMFLKS